MGKRKKETEEYIIEREFLSKIDMEEFIRRMIRSYISSVKREEGKE